MHSALKQKPPCLQATFIFKNNNLTNEVDRHSIPDEGKIGEGIVIELVGFTDNEEEGDHCHTLKTGTNDKQQGTHILQRLFLGITGFRFPIAYFVTKQVLYQAVKFTERYNNSLANVSGLLKMGLRHTQLFTITQKANK
ncbi:hypothetical protein MAR_024169 [Mya arenaria]|uniref:Uncharacterized protein n=1 Tax=Mya arenaria TaxID=6604 RepID=A0ABY7DQ07_MYAAR|nr:hypothetical protein MAR_024169 [Mya arenaria]